jgi:chromate reductase, NAD(P)H dehydrogenase (quinone)
MNNIIYLSGSNSRRSINREFAKYVANQIIGFSSKELDLNDYEVAIYSIDREEESGIPHKIIDFIEEIDQADGIVISLAEHNGNYTVAFKNILDWASRNDRNVFRGKPIFLLSTSPGGRGGENVSNIAKKNFKSMNGNIEAVFKLPSYYGNFSVEEGITENKLDEDFKDELKKFTTSLKESIIN